jgi:uncharacterized protein (DUF1015 family)
VARFEPFPGVRYAAPGVSLGQVIAPPYDVVGPSERTRLASRSPYNAIHLELPEPDLASGRDRYQVAAELLDEWLERRVLVPDPAPAVYPYRMTSPEGFSTTGVIGALGIGEDVLPHEKTLPKPRSDRLDLLRATGANLSPIWGLSLTSGLTATFAPQGPPVADVYDDDGVRHQLWVLDDPGALAAVTQAVGASPVVIADGHHRYETAATFRSEARAANGDRPGDYDAVMALVVELADDQLHVGAIHRLVAGLGPQAAFDALGRWFDAVHAGPASERVVGALADSGSIALVTPSDAWMLTVRDEAAEDAGTDLVAGLADLAIASVPVASVSYAATWREALEVLSGGEADAAVLLQPVTVAQISEWAAQRRRMPPKTTYFSPKPRTGMVMRLLSE